MPAKANQGRAHFLGARSALGLIAGQNFHALLALQLRLRSLRAASFTLPVPHQDDLWATAQMGSFSRGNLDGISFVGFSDRA
jgi:hypothetical protein